MKEIHWFNFADARRPDPVDTRLEGKAQNMGLVGPSSPLPSKGGRIQSRGRDNIATTQEKRAAEAGAAARGGGAGGASQGRKDRCVKGKSCGATCITQANDCILELPEAVQDQVRKMAEYLVKQAEKRGDKIEEGSDRDVQLWETLKGTGRHLTSQGSFGKTKASQTVMITRDELVDLKKNRDKLSNAETNKAAKELWQKEVFSRGAQLSRKDLELLYDSLPPKARTQLNSSGAAPKGNSFGLDKDGNEIITASGPSRERGLRILDMYLKQGGTDAYGNRNRVLSPSEFDVEHIIPLSRGKAQGGIDHPSNWVLARGGAQRKRGESFFKDWIDSMPDPSDKKAMADFFSKQGKELRVSRMASKLAGEVASGFDPKKATVEDIRKLPPKVRKKIDYFAGAPSLIPPGSNSGRLSTSLPSGLHTPYLLSKKFDTDAALRSEITNAWNNEWSRGRGSTLDLVTSIQDSFKRALPAEEYEQVRPDIEKWAATHLRKYPNPGGF
jgi:hypothetical protein